MAIVIAVANQKGGVAKTTTAAALATGLQRQGYKVLAVDLDAQGNLSDNVGADGQNNRTTYEIMKGSVNITDAIQKTEIFDIVPANLALASADMEFTATGREYKLKKALSPIMDQYDYIILDTPPTLGIMTVNAFIVSNEVIIPACGIDGVKGIVNLYRTIDTVREFGNEKLRISGILLTMYNSRTIIDQNIRELAETIGEQLRIPVFKTAIRTSVVVDEAKANQKDLFSYAEKNNVAVDYSNFISEYLKGDQK